ncbi:MAG: alpha/beta fold hydrolase [Candidatus Obscuribacter sp.]|nr:alpha/beta fold hydrolase [Candidatus Melainabacteria bacterium]MDX1987600.1 alpha/beta fold hydrolase [Candidatus Obscuribacter sp.]
MPASHFPSQAMEKPHGSLSLAETHGSKRGEKAATTTSHLATGLKDYEQGNFVAALHAFKAAALDKSLSPVDKIRAHVAAADSAYQCGEYLTALNMHKRNLTVLKAVSQGEPISASKQRKTGSAAESLLPDPEREHLLAETYCDIGEALYELDKHDDAARYFAMAIDCWKTGSGTQEVLLRSLEGMGASLIKDGFYAKALPCYQEVAFLDRLKYGAESIPYAWSLRVLNDIYLKLEDPITARQCFERSVWNFRNANRERLLPVWTKRLANTENPPCAAELDKLLSDRIFGSLGKIADVDFLKAGAYTDAAQYKEDSSEPALKGDTTCPEHGLPWSRRRIAVQEPASMFWVDPREKVQGFVVCIPGFGLHRGSFSDLGESLSSKGFVAASYDVRGFGAYTALKARDRIDLEKSLEDLDDSIIQIRKDFAGVPVFVLGESMGGSLALQFCAKHPELVDGLIAAVPSEQRYRQWLTAGKVILGMLTGSRKQIDVGPVLVNRATQDEGLRQTWTSDPQSRFTATAKELYGFKRFVSRNRDLAKQVKTTPVLMFQGVHDLLIRPEGTISLFKAVASEDKDLMLVGKSEHLVFEEGQFDKALLVSICDWMKTRGSK